MKILVAFLLVCATAVSSEKVDIIANFSLDEHYPTEKIAEETGYQIRSMWLNCDTFDHYITHYYKDDVKKAIVMIDCEIPQVDLSRVPFEKRVLFLWEPGLPSEDYCKQFSRVYTFLDQQVDNQRFFKFFYPQLKPMLEIVPAFNEKKFCVLTAQRYTKEREAIIRFFENKPSQDFDYYGCTPFMQTPCYRGKIPLEGSNCSHPYADDKFAVLKNYRFCICFENTRLNGIENSGIDGYVSEKIFSSFASGCVPIYFGAPNIEKYIPKECFIDYRDFQTNEDLYQFLKAMPEETYNQYIANIRAYLKSEQAQVFTPQHFCEIIKMIE